MDCVKQSKKCKHTYRSQSIDRFKAETLFYIPSSWTGVPRFPLLVFRFTFLTRKTGPRLVCNCLVILLIPLQEDNKETLTGFTAWNLMTLNYRMSMWDCDCAVYSPWLASSWCTYTGLFSSTIGCTHTCTRMDVPESQIKTKDENK